MIKHLLLLLACSGCVLARGGPDFKKWSKTISLEAPRGPHHGASLSFEVLSVSAFETYTALGPDSCAVNFELRITNRSAQPYVLEESPVLVIPLGSGPQPHVLTFRNDERTLGAGQTLESRHQVGINPFACGRPGAELILDGVHVPISR